MHGICLAAVRLREKHRRRKKKERAFEEEGESREPRHELVTTPFLDPNLVSSHSLDDPDPGGNGEESHKEEDLEKQGSREATARAVEEVVSFITSPETSAAFDVLIAFFAECYRQGDGEKRRQHDFSKFRSEQKETKVVGTWTARYRAVPPKIDRRRSILTIGDRFRPSEIDFDRRRSIEGEIDRQRSIEGEKGKKKKRKKRKEYLFPRAILVGAPSPHAVVARGSHAPARRRRPRVTGAFSPTRGDGTSPHMGRKVETTLPLFFFY
ncbi:hypothetical protein BHE74_00053673 [Ensete ventricosum]|nr:hypothetical protein BHE74_00053673 [Ensete ventricosum]